MHHRHFKSGSFFQLLLDRKHLLFLSKNSVFFHFLVLAECSAYNVCYRTTLLVAKLLSLNEVVLTESYLDIGNELSQACTAVSIADSEEAFDSQSYYGYEQSPDDRYNETTFVDCTDNTRRFVCVIRKE